MTPSFPLSFPVWNDLLSHQENIKILQQNCLYVQWFCIIVCLCAGVYSVCVSRSKWTDSVFERRRLVEAVEERKLKVKRTASLALCQDCRQPRVSLSATPRLPPHTGFTVIHLTARVERLAASSEHKYTWTPPSAGFFGGKQSRFSVWSDSTCSVWRLKIKDSWQTLTLSGTSLWWWAVRWKLRKIKNIHLKWFSLIFSQDSFFYKHEKYSANMETIYFVPSSASSLVLVYSRTVLKYKFDSCVENHLL